MKRHIKRYTFSLKCLIFTSIAFNSVVFIATGIVLMMKKKEKKCRWTAPKNTFFCVRFSDWTWFVSFASSVIYILDAFIQWFNRCYIFRKLIRTNDYILYSCVNNTLQLTNYKYINFISSKWRGEKTHKKFGFFFCFCLVIQHVDVKSDIYCYYCYNPKNWIFHRKINPNDKFK